MSSVDVVVPCYNYSRFLEQCVGSALNQDGVEVRVLIIDDCSSDDSPAVGARLAERDKRVEFRRHQKNKGHIATYNEGLLEWCKADYSLLLSADDMLAPGALGRAARVMDQHPEVGMTYGLALVIVDGDAGGEAAGRLSGEQRILSGAKFLQHCFEESNPVPTPSAVVRTRLQQSLGGYRPEYPHAGDMEMWMRFAAHGSIGVVHAVQAYYRWHTTNMSHQHYSRLTGELAELEKVCSDVLTKYGARFPESSGWAGSFAMGLGRKAISSASRTFNEGRLADCDAQRDFALRIWPAARTSAGWWRLAAKRFLGQALWQRLRPAVHRLRGVPGEGGASPILWRGLQMGWWPG